MTKKAPVPKKQKLDHNRIKTQKSDAEGVQNNDDEILSFVVTHLSAANPSQEDLHEKLGDEKNDILTDALDEIEKD